MQQRPDQMENESLFTEDMKMGGNRRRCERKRPKRKLFGGVNALQTH